MILSKRGTQSDCFLPAVSTTSVHAQGARGPQVATLVCHAAAKAKLRVVILQRERGGECRQVGGG